MDQPRLSALVEADIGATVTCRWFFIMPQTAARHQITYSRAYAWYILRTSANKERRNHAKTRNTRKKVSCTVVSSRVWPSDRVVPGVYRGVSVDFCLGCIEVIVWTVVPGVYRSISVDCFVEGALRC